MAETVRKTRTFLDRCDAPCRAAIKKLVEKFELLGQVSDVKSENRARRSRTAENIAAVAESGEENPGLSIPRCSLELGIPQTSLHRILQKDLVMENFKGYGPVSVVVVVICLMLFSTINGIASSLKRKEHPIIYIEK